MPSVIESYGTMTGTARASAGDARKRLAQFAGFWSLGTKNARTARMQRRIRQLMTCRDSARASRKAERSMLKVEHQVLDTAIEQPATREDSEKTGLSHRGALGVMVHKLKTPLSVMIASLDMLAHSLGDDASETQRGVISVANQSGEKMLQLLNDLAEMERTELGRTSVDPRSLDLPPLLRAAVKQVRPLAERCGVTVVLRTDDVLPQVWANKDLTHQVVTSLLDNAIRLTPHNGQIVVICQARERDVLVCVTDSERCAPRGQSGGASERTLRVEQATCSDLVRNSLGLAFCKLAVESQHGDIWIESSTRQGVDFRFTLPQWR
jgi:signal transduction histidine kinase